MPCADSTATTDPTYICGSIMAESLDTQDLVTLDELAISTMWENAALVELLERKGILIRGEVLDMIQELRRQHSHTITWEPSHGT